MINRKFIGQLVCRQRIGKNISPYIPFRTNKFTFFIYCAWLCYSRQQREREREKNRINLNEFHPYNA